MCLLLQSVNENMLRRIRRLDGQARILRVSWTECTKHILLALTSYIYFLSFIFVVIIGMAAQAALGI